MTAVLDILRAILQQASAQGTKSTVLNPLGWFLGILATLILGCLKLNAPLWVLVVFVVMLVLAGLLYFAAYAFCLFKNPEVLRSERYSIQKLAIESGYLGDNLVGLIKTAELSEKNPVVADAEAKPK
jgi:hypothetical protein